MTQCIQNKKHVPRGCRWKCRHPVSGQYFQNPTLRLLYKEVKKHHQVMDYPIGLDFTGKVDEWICAEMPEECGPCDGTLPIQPPSRLSVDDILRGTRVFLRIAADRLTGENPYVSQSEAEARAAECVACPFNVKIQVRCSKCRDLGKLLANRQTRYDERLRACAICHCFLAAAVHVRLETQWNVLNDEQKDAFRKMNCWKNAERKES